MAIKFNVTDEAALSRQDTFRVNPDDIKDGRNSRMIPAADYADTVRARAVSIAREGQLQPCEVRLEGDRTLSLVLGYTRRDAVRLLRQGFDAIDPDTGETVRFYEPGATLWVKVVKVGIDEAFLRGIKENLERKDTTDLQEALAQQELRTTMGWTDSKIARFYGYTNQNRVSALTKLLALPADVQQMVHTGKLALYAALDTLGLSDTERSTLFDGAVGENGKIAGGTLRKLIRDLYEKRESAPSPTPTPTPTPAGDTPEAPDDRVIVEGEDDKPASIKKPARTRKDLERFLVDSKDGDLKIGDSAAELLDILVLWMKGKRTDRYLAEALNTHCK